MLFATQTPIINGKIKLVDIVPAATPPLSNARAVNIGVHKTEQIIVTKYKTETKVDVENNVIKSKNE